MKETVSVIVPVYNTEAYLTNCVNSILSQSYPHLEVILVDDGSEDRSPELCDGFSKVDPRVRVIHQANQGVSAARNAGMDVAQGEYLMFVDSDDTISANAVELLLQDIKKYQADIVSAVKSAVHPDGREDCPYGNGEIHVYDGIAPLKLSLEYDRQTNSACAKLFRRNFVGEIRFAVGKHVHEDGYFIFQCNACSPRLVQHNVSIYQYTVREQSATRNGFSEKFFDMLFFAEKKKEYIEKNCPELLDSAINMEVSTHLFFLDVLCRTKDKKYLPARKTSIQAVRSNYRNYRTANSHERKMSWIVAHGLYPLYHWVWGFKYDR